MSIINKILMFLKKWLIRLNTILSEFIWKVEYGWRANRYEKRTQGLKRLNKNELGAERMRLIAKYERFKLYVIFWVSVGLAVAFSNAGDKLSNLFVEYLYRKDSVQSVKRLSRYQITQLNLDFQSGLFITILVVGVGLMFLAFLYRIGDVKRELQFVLDETERRKNENYF